MDSIRLLALPDGRPVKCIEYDSFGNVALEHAGRAAGAATAYAPTAINAARSAAGGAYYKAKPVVGKAVSAVRKLPSEPEKLGRVVKGVTDFAEGTMPGPPSNMSWPKIIGYGSKWMYDEY